MEVVGRIRPRRFVCSSNSLFYLLCNGKVEHTCIPLLGCWLLGGALVQYTVAIIELKEGATTGGNVFLFFSAFFYAGWWDRVYF